MFKPGCLFHNWRRLHLTSGLVQMLETWKSNWLGKELADVEAECFLAKHWEWFFPFLLPFPTMFFFSFIPWKSLSFFCQPIALPWPGKTTPLFIYLGQLQKWGIQPSVDCWIYYDASDSVIPLITKLFLHFQCLSFSGAHLWINSSGEV